MSSSQEFPVAPPTKNDLETFKDFSEIIQRNLRDLFELSHEHRILTSAPTLSDLEAGVSVVVNLNGVFYLYVKVSATQIARVALTLV